MGCKWNAYRNQLCGFLFFRVCLLGLHMVVLLLLCSFYVSDLCGFSNYSLIKCYFKRFPNDGFNFPNDGFCNPVNLCDVLHSVYGSFMAVNTELIPN